MSNEHAAPQCFTDLNKLRIAIRLGSYRGEFLYWGYFDPEYWRNYLHIHSFFEICYAYQGRGTFRICDKEYAIETGHLFVAKPSEPHEIISDLDDPLGIYFWSYTLLPAAAAGAHDHYTANVDPASADPNTESINRLLQEFGGYQRWVSDNVGAIPSTLQLLTDEIGTRYPGYVQKVQSLTTTLLIDTARAVIGSELRHQPQPALAEPAGNEVAKEIVRYLHDNYDRPLQVRNVAAHLHLSERHTSRIFQQAMGVSIHQYLVQFRLSIAKQRLLDQSESVSAVARSLGYQNVHHFSTLFRKHTGLTPTAFRSAQGTSFLEAVDS